MQFSLATILAFTAALSVSAEDAALKDIPTTAIDNGTFTTLVAALTAADLVTTLSGDGPFTVFAPDDDAFAALEKVDKTLIPCLLLPENVETLTTILTYHVAAGEVRSTDLSNGQQIPSLQGEDISVDITGTTVMLNDAAQVIAADVMATNGVIHVIDAVLVPPTVSIEDFLVLCREMNPDVDPVKGGKEDEALTEDKTDTNGDADTADMAEDDSASSVISTMAGLIGAALVTVFGM
mmetsp:Transcript_24906/g.26741  ORF Transcript_24906/g.26741 Transcript_24906/m.26741 type:complete len:237 (+) Transcript_24906:168-878(+)